MTIYARADSAKRGRDTMQVWQRTRRRTPVVVDVSASGDDAWRINIFETTPRSLHSRLETASSTPGAVTPTWIIKETMLKAVAYLSYAWVAQLRRRRRNPGESWPRLLMAFNFVSYLSLPSRRREYGLACEGYTSHNYCRKRQHFFSFLFHRHGKRWITLESSTSPLKTMEWVHTYEYTQLNSQCRILLTWVIFYYSYKSPLLQLNISSI